MALQYTIRPLTAGVVKKRPVRSPFGSNWSSTLDLLERELRFLQARQVVLQIDVTERDIRNDGMLRANASADEPSRPRELWSSA